MTDENNGISVKSLSNAFKKAALNAGLTLGASILSLAAADGTGGGFFLASSLAACVVVFATRAIESFADGLEKPVEAPKPAQG